MSESKPQVAQQASYNKNEKGRDIRLTNIQAAKGIHIILFSCG